MASGSPDWSPRVISSAQDSEDLKISVTASDSSESFAQEVKSALIYNDGPNDVFNENDATASTSNFKIKARSWHSIDLNITTPHFICESGKTATVFVRGVF